MTMPSPHGRLIAHSDALRRRAVSLSQRAELATARATRNRFAYIERRTRFLITHPAAAAPMVRRVLAIVSRRAAQRLTLARLGRLVGISPWHLNVVFRRSTGMTIHEYATSVRMRRAVRELERGTKIEAVAREVGYRSRQSFYRQFRTWFGTTPGGHRMDR